MQGIRGVCALVALTCLADLLLWRCHAECDKNIIDSIKSKHRDPYEFQIKFSYVFSGELQILQMATSTDDLSGQTGTKCLKMNLDQKSKLKIESVDDKEYHIKLDTDENALITEVQGENGQVHKIRYQIAYMSWAVAAFYICSDTVGDPALSVLVMPSWQTDYLHFYQLSVDRAKKALEDEGIKGFAKIPATC